MSDLSGDGLNVLLRDLLCNASVSNKIENVTRLNSSFPQLVQIKIFSKPQLFKLSDCSFKRSGSTNPSALLNRARDFLHFPTPPRPNESNTLNFLFSLYVKNGGRERERETDKRKKSDSENKR